jgi:hypothetical protein
MHDEYRLKLLPMPAAALSHVQEGNNDKGPNIPPKQFSYANKSIMSEMPQAVG